MICMELTRTDAVFSRTTVVLFFCRNKSSPNATKLFDNFFWNKRDTRSFVGGPEGEGGEHKTPGHARRPMRAQVGCAHLEAHLHVIPTLKNHINRETPRNNPRTWTPPPQVSVPSKYHLEPCSGTLPEGEIITGGHLRHPGGLHDEEGVVHPRG